MDSLILKKRSISGHSLFLAVVCDGVGSLEAGGFASSRATSLLGSWFDSLSITERLGLSLRDRVLSASREIAEEAGAHQFQTATTLSALLLADGRYYIVHVGDSRIYGSRGGELVRLTEDHVSAAGKLTCVVGYGREILPYYDEGESDYSGYLLCSDGLYKQVPEELLARQMKGLKRYNLKPTLNGMVKFAVDRGEEDNISIALVLCGK